jgi:hypothetical protein
MEGLRGLGLTLDASPSGALFSSDRRYRYLLTRCVEANDDLFTTRRDYRAVLFVMLNPSTADETQDDPTIRRCTSFARGWGYTHLVVANLFAFRSTDPRALADEKDPVGPENDRALQAALEDNAVRRVVCAWGVHDGPIRGLVQARADHVLSVLRTHEPVCFGLAGQVKARIGVGRQPRHPLYLPEDAPVYKLHALYESGRR